MSMEFDKQFEFDEVLNMSEFNENSKWAPSTRNVLLKFFLLLRIFSEFVLFEIIEFKNNGSSMHKEFILNEMLEKII